MHGSVRTQDIAKSAEAEIRIRQMVQHSRADDLIELTIEIAHVLDSETMQVEVLETIFVSQIACVAEAGFADIDCSNAGLRLAESVASRLGCAAARHENFLMRGRRRGREHQMEHRAAAKRVFVKLAMLVEAVDRSGIGEAFVEIADVGGGGGHAR